MSSSESFEKPIKLVTRPDSMGLTIVWSVHNLCNYKCSYCPPYNSSATENWMKKENVFSFIDSVKRHYCDGLGYKKVTFSLTGGEPTLLKDLPEICQRIRENNMTIGLTSNGALPLSKWESFAPKLDWLCLSYHAESAKDEHFYSLLKYFHDRPDLVLPAVRFMMHPEEKLWNKCLNFAERIKNEFENWSIELVKIENGFGPGLKPVKYSPEQLEFLGAQKYEERKGAPELIPATQELKMLDVTYDNGNVEQLRANDLVNRDLVNFRGWSCYIGIESLMIHPSGKITRAGCEVGGKIGWIQQKEPIRFPSEAVYCRVPRCWCGTDISVTKYGPRSNAPRVSLYKVIKDLIHIKI